MRKYWLRSDFVRGALTALGALAFLVGLSACDGAEEPLGDLPPNRTILETVEQQTDLSTLERLVEEAGVGEVLSGEGPITLFAVRNNGFEEIDTDSLLANPGLLEELVQYHIVEGEVLASDLTDGTTLTTLQGEELFVSRQGEQILINGVPLTTTNINVQNGVIHGLSRLLFTSLVDQANYTTNLSTLMGALEATETTGLLEGDEPVTVFAPTNAAFEGVGGLGPDSLLADADLLERVLSYHVVPGKVDLASLEDGATLETSEGAELDVRVGGDGTVFIDGVPVSTMRTETAGGVIYQIDEVLLGNATVAERLAYMDATSAEDLATANTLVGDLRSTGLYGTLGQEGPYTVFAPTNSALEAINADTLRDQPALLEEVLRYHVVEGERITSSDIQDGETVMSLEGTDLNFTVNAEGNVEVNGVPLATTDIKTRNGVIHLIDGVLLETLTAAQRIMVDPQTSTLTAALETANLTGTLNGGGPFTVLAPINSAFDNIDADTLLDQQALLEEVLQYHVIEGRELTASDISEGMEVETLEGGTVTFSVEDGSVIVNGENGATFTTTDIQTENGVIHLIDDVLLETASVAERTMLMPQTNTLAGALAEADLVSALDSDGPYTVFAPVNSAFENIDADTLLDQPELLDRVLNYHIVEGQELTADELSGTVETQEGSSLTFSMAGGNVTINGMDGAVITTTDIQTENGVIHLIDDVLIENVTIAEYVTLAPNFSALADAIEAAGLTDDLDDNTGPYTVFAPSDAAADTLAALVEEGTGANALANIVNYHIVEGELTAGEISNGQTVTTLQGDELTFRTTDEGNVEINGEALITDTDRMVRNGLVHTIDAVLFPPEPDGS